MELSVTADYGDDGVVVEVSGALDAFTAPFLGDYLDLARTTAGPRLELRLGGVSFVDCAGLRVLLAAREEAMSQGGWLRLAAVPAGVRRVIGLTGSEALLDHDVPLGGLRSAPR